MPDFKKLQDSVKKNAAVATEKAKDAAEKVQETKLSSECDSCGTKVEFTVAQARTNESVTCSNVSVSMNTKSSPSL